MLSLNLRVKWARKFHSAFKMDDNLLLLYTSLILASVVGKKNVKNRKKKQRKEWVKGWLANRARKGAYTNIIRELKVIDKENYRQYLSPCGCRTNSFRAEEEYQNSNQRESRTIN